MQIDVTFDSSVAGAPAGFKACVYAACQYYDTLFTNTAVVAVTASYGSIQGQPLGQGSLGQSLFDYYPESYSRVRGALLNQAAPGAATLPATSPFAGEQLAVPTAEAKALNLATGSYGPDGYIGVSAGMTYYVNPTQTGHVPYYAIDLVSVIEHEVSEVLGRSSFIDSSASAYGVVDLYRYQADGMRQLGMGAPSYFSLDSGKTVLNYWNNPVTGDSGDLADWAPSAGYDAYDDSSSSGALNPVTLVDKELMAAIGWRLNANWQSLSVANSIPTLSAGNAVSEVAAQVALYVTVSDSAANIGANLDGLTFLLANSNLAGIQVSDGGSVTANSAQLVSDEGLLAAIGGHFSLAVSGALSGADLTAINLPQVTGVSISGSAATLSAELDLLQSVKNIGKLTTIADSDSGYASLSVTPAQLSADAGALAMIGGTYFLTVPASGANLAITGPGGIGTVVQFSGNESQFTLAAAGDGSDLTVSASGSVDHIGNVTELKFDDFTDIVATTPGPASTPTTGNVTEIYAAVLAREPDVPGLAYYQNIVKTMPSVQLIVYAEWFLQSPEYVNNSAHNYAQNTAGNSQFITDAYNNLLHRAPESGAVPYYLNIIDQVMAASGQTPGTAFYASWLQAAHATVITDFSQSAEFLGDVQINAAHPADAQHWLFLV